MIINEFDKLIEELFRVETPKTTTYVPSKFAVDLKEDSATMALSVLGHNPNDIEINCFEDKIEIKAKKTQEDKENPFNQLISDIDERVQVGKNFDGRKSKAEIKNGIHSFPTRRSSDDRKSVV